MRKHWMDNLHPWFMPLLYEVICRIPVVKWCVLGE